MLNYSRIKAVGIVDRKIGENNALIRIIAVNNDNKLSQNFDMVEYFPPKGDVFGPSFFIYNPKIQEGELINLECQENELFTKYSTNTKVSVY